MQQKFSDLININFCVEFSLFFSIKTSFHYYYLKHKQNKKKIFKILTLFNYNVYLLLKHLIQLRYVMKKLKKKKKMLLLSFKRVKSSISYFN